MVTRLVANRPCIPTSVAAVLASSCSNAAWLAGYRLRAHFFISFQIYNNNEVLNKGH